MWVKTILLGGGLFFSTFAMAQSPVKGKIEMKTLTNDANHAWFYAGINKYQPNDKAVDYLKSNNTKYKIVAITGTTDDNSKKLLPAFYKTMILSSWPDDNIELYAADDKLQTGDNKGQSFKAKKLPTFVVLKEGKEVGRVAGDINESIEKDLAVIIFNSNKKSEEK
ncbi:hypothetical protein LX64_02810 [Chitinophaga skermanii]|uniref:Thioredoxin-like protein n=1 Tax=Chitinophaga skermanii TaxID=331697 RepID=A0A327QKQ7_9BACT|nr:hypothetical protein [Chitinophaga skermanii]RAJ03933.1 hypothetical protein LX64_02810 [Chitinophaga skermanii]